MSDLIPSATIENLAMVELDGCSSFRFGVIRSKEGQLVIGTADISAALSHITLVRLLLRRAFTMPEIMDSSIPFPVKMKQYFVGAGTSTPDGLKRDVVFESDSCEDKFGFSTPKDISDKKTITETILTWDCLLD